MEKIRICGMGLVNRAGTTTETFWENLCRGEVCGSEEPAVAFRLDYPASRLRRMNRYCKLALYAADGAWKDAGLPGETNPLERGTIFATGYGSMAAHVKFCRETAKGDPDLCSPTVFTGIVPNSCVGTVCMFLECKGVSTVLSGGNQLEYSQLLLENGRAGFILAGAVEEYCGELLEGLIENPLTQGTKCAEGCVVFALAPGDAGTGYAALERTNTVGLPGFPLLFEVDGPEAARAMKGLLAEYAKEQPDMVLSGENGTGFDRWERQALLEYFTEAQIAGKVKQITGETLGCGFTMNVAAAALCLKHGYVPAALTGTGEDCPVEKLLATGFDTAGNYMCALLSK